MLFEINKDTVMASVYNWSEVVWQAWAADHSTIIELYNTSHVIIDFILLMC